MLRNILAAATLLTITMGCAPFSQADELSMTPDQASLIDATCSNVMGLRKGEFYFGECKDSLAHSLARKVAAEASSRSYADCRHQGLPEGSAALSSCILNSEQPSMRRVSAAPQAVPVSFAGVSIESGKSYYSITPSVQWQRKRYACAQLGLMPNGGLFGECVASLEGALLPNPG